MATILVVDDNSITQRMVGYILQQQGHHVVAAEHGHAALTLLDEQTCDLVIADLTMPIMDGLTLLHHLRADERYHALPVVMLTASVLDQDRRRAQEGGASAFLTKPATSCMLHTTLSQLLA